MRSSMSARTLAGAEGRDQVPLDLEHLDVDLGLGAQLEDVDVQDEGLPPDLEDEGAGRQRDGVEQQVEHELGRRHEGNGHDPPAEAGARGGDHGPCDLHVGPDRDR